MNPSAPSLSGEFHWQLLADMHRPIDAEVIAAEMRRLRLQGLLPRDISAALRVDLGVVLQALHQAGGSR